MGLYFKRVFKSKLTVLKPAHNWGVAMVQGHMTVGRLQYLKATVRGSDSDLVLMICTVGKDPLSCSGLSRLS